MIVILNTPGIKTLPYRINNMVKHYRFIPGRNEISEIIWKAVLEGNKERFENYYNGILKEFKPKNSDAIVEADKKVEIFINRLTDEEAETIVENTFESVELEKYEKQEKGRRQKRKYLLKKIEAQKEEIKAFEEKIKK